MMTIVRPVGISARALLGCATVAATLSMALWHVRAAQGAFWPDGFVRLSLSLGAISAVYFARRQTLVRQALCLLAVETAGGILAFVLVDVPFVQGHSNQIGAVAVGVYERFHERAP